MQSSIFRLDEIRCDKAESPNYLEAITSIRGHFSSLEKAITAMKRNASETYLPEEIYAYLIKEIAIDGNLGDVDWLSVRSYDPSGQLLEECLEDYNLVNQYHGRNKEDIHFKVGDIVEALCYNRIDFGIIAALPPTPEDHFPMLDASDDCYLILLLSPDSPDHLHIAPTHVFSLHHTISEIGLSYLRNRLLIWQGKEDEVDFKAICEIEGHDFKYNFPSMPSKRTCRRCHRKWKADYSGDIINGDVWTEVDGSNRENVTDE